MPLIDYTYFIGVISIPEVADSNGGASPIMGDTVNTVFIGRYETPYLRKALGYAFAKAFLDGLQIDPTEQRWLDIKGGKEYTIADKKFYWPGFVNDEKISPLANYIYCEYMRDNATTTTAVGEAKPQIQNATMASVTQKISRAWTDMKRMTEYDYDNSIQHFLQNNLDTYPEFDLSAISCFGSLNFLNL